MGDDVSSNHPFISTEGLIAWWQIPYWPQPRENHEQCVYAAGLSRTILQC